MIDVLSIDRFHDLVASYGADPERWPADLRGAAIGCLVESDAARAAWRDAADLDGDLDSVPGLDTSPELVERVLAIAEAPERRNTGLLSRATHSMLPYAAAAAIALVVGLSLPSPLRDAGVTSPPNQVAVSGPVTVVESVGSPGSPGSPGSDDGLTTLALVDAVAFADDQTDTGEALGTEGLLSRLPLL